MEGIDREYSDRKRKEWKVGENDSGGYYTSWKDVKVNSIPNPTGTESFDNYDTNLIIYIACPKSLAHAINPTVRRLRQ